jgi:hypothetical protein
MHHLRVCECRSCKKIGPQVWLIMTIVITELLIALKFDWHTFTLPPPTNVVVFWSVLIAVLSLWTLWHFYLQRLLHHTEVKLSRTNSEAVLGSTTGEFHFEYCIDGKCSFVVQMLYNNSNLMLCVGRILV